VAGPTVRELLAAAVAAIGGTERAGQVRMAEAVVESIESGRHLFVQAGTGTGKSLAYLVPALAHGDRVVVATATIALQSQLIDRDLPRLVDAVEPLLGGRPSFAILKGRRNYACLQRLNDGPDDADEFALFDIEAAATPERGRAVRVPGATSTLGKEVVRLQEWAARTRTGDRDDVTPGVSDRGWAQVSVSAQDCVGAHRCAYGEECFAERARERAAAADIVVTNHALLAIDALEPFPILGEHGLVVVDEAHELVDRVTNIATDEMRVASIERVVRRAQRHVKERPTDAMLAAGTRLALVLDKIEPGRLDNLSSELAGVLAEVRDSAHALVSGLGRGQSGDGPGSFADALRRRARAAAEEVHEVAGRLLEHSDHDVTWMEDDERLGPALKVAPLSVAGLLRDALFAKRTVVLTSATLALGGSFDIVARQVGLSARDAQGSPRNGLQRPAVDATAADPQPGGVREVDEADGDLVAGWDGLDVGSPFDYPRQAILYVARRLPPPGRDGIGAEAVEELTDLIRAAGGRTLGLFSSHRAAVAAAEALRSRIPYPVLLQGQDSTGQLVKRFAADPRTCLFGTLSLWQGVDVPGASCQLVVIDRLPFPRPDDPIRSARQRAVDAAGGNGFMTIAAAHAALLLGQGAGRLIRSASDRGVVAVLDPRLATARYAGFLKASMPRFWYTENPERVRRSLAAIDDKPA
jgi:ATP-dependent DNA helicase DinG